ncbi:MAG: hypothetical protein AAF235_04410 [Planctomycetota bacterium]
MTASTQDHHKAAAASPAETPKSAERADRAVAQMGSDERPDQVIQAGRADLAAGSARYPVPLLVRVVVGIGGIAIVAGSLFSGYVAIAVVGALLPNLLLFSMVGVVAGVFAVLVAAGRFTAGPAIAMLCIAGAIGAGSVMGYTEAKPNLTNLAFYRDSMRLWQFGGIGLAGVMTLGAAVSVWSRRPAASLRRLGFALLTGLPLAGLLYAASVGLSTASGLVVVVGVLVGGLLAVGLAAATGHQIIRAFEVSGEPGPDTTAAAAS